MIVYSLTLILIGIFLCSSLLISSFTSSTRSIFRLSCFSFFNTFLLSFLGRVGTEPERGLFVMDCTRGEVVGAGGKFGGEVAGLFGLKSSSTGRSVNVSSFFC